MARRHSPRHRGLAAGSLVVLLTGCGVADQDDRTSRTDAELSIGSFPGTIFTYPLSVAREQGYFEDHGLTVDVVDGTSGPDVMAGMLGGTTDIVFAQPATMIAASREGEPLTAVGPFSRGRVVIVATEASGVRDLAGLQRARVAVPQRRDSNEQRLRTVLAEYDVDASGITFISTGTPATTVAALANDRADAGVMGLSTYESLLASGVGLRILADSSDGTMGERGENEVTGVFATTEAFLEDDPGAVRSFCRAMASAIDWIADAGNRVEAVRLLSEWTGLEADAAGRVYDSERDIWSMSLDEDVWTANVGYVDESLDPRYDEAVINDCEA